MILDTVPATDKDRIIGITLCVALVNDNPTAAGDCFKLCVLVAKARTHHQKLVDEWQVIGAAGVVHRDLVAADH